MEILEIPEVMDEVSDGVAPTFRAVMMDLLSHYSAITLEECKQWNFIIALNFKYRFLNSTHSKNKISSF